MEYLDFLEHMRTLLRDIRKGNISELGGLAAHVENEIESEHQRGELALKLAEKQESQEPFRCTQCGDAIWYGERQHVCRGGK